MPLLDGRSKEVKIAGSLITSAIIRAALLGSASRLGSSAGLAALALVGLGDFSLHIPATQVVLALFIGADRDERLAGLTSIVQTARNLLRIDISKTM